MSAAIDSGVKPAQVLASMLAPWLRSSAIMSGAAVLAAKIIALQLSASTASMECGL